MRGPAAPAQPPPPLGTFRRYGNAIPILRAVRHLTARHRGAVIVVTSTAAFPPFAHLAVYAASFGKWRTPEQVVVTAPRGLEKGRPSVVDGRSNALIASLQRFLAHRAVLCLAERTVRPRTQATR